MTGLPLVPRDPAAFARAVRALDWGDLLASLTRFALYRCKHEEMARDLAQEAIRRFIDPVTSTWDPEANPNPTRLLMSGVNSLLANDHTSARATRSVPISTLSRQGEANDEVERDLDLPDDRAFSESAYASRDLHSRRLTLLRHRLANDPFALQILDWMMTGHDTPADLCALSGRSLNDVNAARRRLSRNAEQVASELADGLADGNEDDEPSDENRDDLRVDVREDDREDEELT